MKDSIFTKIIKGEIPANKIYEDDKTIAFLDIHPVTEGHTLVVPKTQVEFVWDLPEEDYLALQRTVQKVALHLRETLAVPYVGEQIIGVDVPHAHIQLIPFRTATEFRRVVDMNADSDFDALAATGAKLKLV